MLAAARRARPVLAAAATLSARVAATRALTTTAAAAMAAAAPSAPASAAAAATSPPPAPPVVEAVGPVADLIRARITAALAPIAVVLENESYKHSVPPGSESHFKVLVAPAALASTKPLARHRAVTGAVAGPDGALPVPALSIATKTPDAYTPGEGAALTPACKGGFGK